MVQVYCSKSVKKQVVLLLSFLCLVAVSFGQIDTEFWFAVPRLTHDHAGKPIKICISTFEESATVTIRKPADNNQLITTHTIAANSSWQYELVANNDASLALYECPPNQISNKAIYIHSTSKINAYVSIMGNNSEIYALKGKNGLGKKFYIPMQFSYNNANMYQTDPCRNNVEVIATEDNTQITIIPSVALYGGYPAGQPIVKNLNRGQVYCFASASKLANQHLNGSTIVSTKPIVVDISDDSVTPDENRQDLVADQIVPEDMAGYDYVVIPSPSAASNTISGSMCDYAYIFPLENGTNVTVYKYNSNTSTNYSPTTYSNLNRGDKREIHFTNNKAIYINADKPIFVFQLTGAAGELGGTLLPHVYCTGSKEVSYRPQVTSGNTKNIYLTLICNPIYTSGFQITAHQPNGTTTNIPISSNNWIDVPGHVLQYHCGTHNALSTADYITIKNTQGKFHLGIIDWNTHNGGSLDCSISYFSNYDSESKLKWDTTSTLKNYCEGETINFTFDTVNMSILRLEGPNGLELNTIDTFILANVTQNNSGDYVIIGKDSRGCLEENFTDTLTIEIHPTIKTLIKDTVCFGASYTDYGFNISAESTKTSNLVKDSIILQQSVLGCDSIVRLELSVRDSIGTEFEATYCNEYSWNGQPYTSSGNYRQTLVSKEGCDSVVTMHLTIIEPEVRIISTGDDFCDTEQTTLTAISEFENYEWSTGDTTESIEVTKPGLYKVTVTDETGLCRATTNYVIPTCNFNFFLPNSISPSKPDGVNDVLKIPEEIHRYIKDFSIEIYNRWGTCVFKSNDINFKWNGKSAIPEKGKKTYNYSDRVFMYKISYRDLENRKFFKKGEIIVL